MLKKFYYIPPIIIQILIGKIFVMPILSYFMRIEIIGIQNVNRINSPVIFASNHTSEIDSLILPLCFPFFSKFTPIFYTVRDNKYYDDPKFSWRKYFYNSFVFFLVGGHKLNGGKRDYEKSLFNHIRIINNGGSVCIYPEGEISNDGNIKKAHGGVAYLAEKTNTPIIPVAFSGLWGMTFKDFILRKNKVTIKFGNPIYLDKISIKKDNTEDYYKSVACYIMDIVGEMVIK